MAGDELIEGYMVTAVVWSGRVMLVITADNGEEAKVLWINPLPTGVPPGHIAEFLNGLSGRPAHYHDGEMGVRLI